MFQKIDHVEIVTQEPERAVAFYTGVIGFKEKLRQHVPLSGGTGSLRIVYLELSGTAIELLTYDGLPVGPAPQKLQLGYRLMALAVENMQQALGMLTTKGIEPVWVRSPSTGTFGRRCAIRTAPAWSATVVPSGLSPRIAGT